MIGDIDFSKYEIKRPKEHYVYVPSSSPNGSKKSFSKPKKKKKVKFEKMTLNELMNERARLNKLMDIVYSELIEYNAKLSKAKNLTTRKNLECRVSERVYRMNNLNKRIEIITELINKY